MTRGIFLLAPNGYGKILANILDGIPINSFFWKVEHVEAYSGNADMHSDNRFDTAPMTGNDFFNTINEDPNYLLMFGEFSAFYKESDIVEIKTYDDFIESNCQLLILVADTTFFEIYAKDLATIEKIKQNAEKLDYEKVEYITDENDQRTRMSIW